MSAVRDSGDETLARDLPAKGIAVVDFWATWCGPCRGFAPVFESSAARHLDVVHLKVDVDTNQQLAATYEIRSIPTTMFVRDGVVVGRIAGALSAARLDELLEQTRGLDMERVREEAAR